MFRVSEITACIPSCMITCVELAALARKVILLFLGEKFPLESVFSKDSTISTVVLPIFLLMAKANRRISGF